MQTLILRQRSLRLIVLIAGLLFLLTAAQLSTTYAQADLEVDVSSIDVQLNFPENITFTLDARSDGAQIVEAELLYGGARSDARTIVPVEVTPGQQISVQHILNTQVYHLTVGTDLAYSWLLRDAEGNEFETPTETLVYFDTRFDWDERAERNVTIYWYAGGSSFGDQLIDIAVSSLEQLEGEIGKTIEDPVKIYIYQDTNDMRGALRSNSVDWVGGQAVPSLGLIIGAVAPGDLSEAGRIIPHEISHQVLHQAVENPYGGTPLWFDEGLAVHNQATPDFGFTAMIDEAARNDQLIPLEALAASFPADPNRAVLSYAQSHSVVEHIIATYGTEAIADLVDAFAIATPLDDALEEAVGKSIDELDAEWRSTLPPAEEQRSLIGSPATAPASRFSGEPVVPQSDGSPPPLPAPDNASFDQPFTFNGDSGDIPAEPGLMFAPWLGVSVLLVGCLGMVAVTGVVLFAVFRLAR